MKSLPSWIKKILEDEHLTCGQCNNLFKYEDLLSVGVQKSNHKKEKEVLFIGIICKECKEMTVFELQEMSLLELSIEVLGEQTEKEINNKKRELDNEIKNENKKEDNQNKSDIIKPKRIKKMQSRITVKEIKDIKDFLNSKDYFKVENYDDFLIAMGMCLEDIDKYKIKKRKRKDKNEN